MQYETLNLIMSPVLVFLIKTFGLTSWTGNAAFHGTGRPLWACGSSCYALKRMSFWNILIRIQSLTAMYGLSVMLGWSL